jgi:hypothetical protein
VGGKGRRQLPTNGGEKKDDGAALFSIAPPPAGAKISEDGFADPGMKDKTAEELGFDDGEFGEFQ